MIEQLKKLYYFLENTYYEFVESLDTVVPVSNFVDRIDKTAPSFPISTLIVFALLSAIVFLPSGLAGNYYYLQILNKSNGQAIEGLTVFLDGQAYTTDSMGKIQITEAGEKRLTIQDSKYEEKDTYIEITNEIFSIYLGEKAKATKYKVYFYDLDSKKENTEEKYMVIKCETGNGENKRFSDSEIEISLENCQKAVAKITVEGYKETTKALTEETKIYLEKEIKNAIFQIKVLEEDNPIEKVELQAKNKQTEEVYYGTTESDGIGEIIVSAGEYEITAVTQDGGTGYSEANIAEGEILPIQINLKAGVMGDKKISLEILKNGKKEKAVIKIFEKGKTSVLYETEAEEYSQIITDGEYRVFIYHNGYTSVFDLQLFEKTSSEKQTITLNEGELKTLTINVTDEEGNPINADIKVFFKGFLESPAGTGSPVNLRTGEYTIIAKTNDLEKEEEINLTDNQEITINLVAGKGGVLVEVYDYDTKAKLHEVYDGIKAKVIFWDAETNKIYKECETKESICQINEIPADKVLAIEARAEGLQSEFYKSTIDIQNNKTEKIKIYLGEKTEEISFYGIKSTANKTNTQITPNEAKNYYLEFRLPDKGKYFIETEGTDKISFNSVEGLVLGKRYSCNQPIETCIKQGVYQSPLMELNYDYEGGTNILIKIKTENLNEGTAIPLYYYKEGEAKKKRTLIVGEKICSENFSIYLTTPEQAKEGEKFDIEYSVSSCNQDTQGKVQILIEKTEEILNKEVYSGLMMIDSPIEGKESLEVISQGTAKIKIIVKDMQNNLLMKKEWTINIVAGDEIILDCPGKIYKQPIMSLTCTTKSKTGNLGEVKVYLENIIQETSNLTTKYSNSDGSFSLEFELGEIEQPAEEIILKAIKSGYRQTEKRIPLEDFSEQINTGKCLEIGSLDFTSQTPLQFIIENKCNDSLNVKLSSELFTKIQEYTLAKNGKQTIVFTKPEILGAYQLTIEENHSGIKNIYSKTIIYKGEFDWLKIKTNLQNSEEFDFSLAEKENLIIENTKPIAVNNRYPKLEISNENGIYSNSKYSIEKNFSLQTKTIEGIIAENKELQIKPHNQTAEKDCFEINSNQAEYISEIGMEFKSPANIIVYKEDNWEQFNNYEDKTSLRVLLKSNGVCGFEIWENENKRMDMTRIWTPAEISTNFTTYLTEQGNYGTNDETEGNRKRQLFTKEKPSTYTQPEAMIECINKIENKFGEEITKSAGIIIPQMDSELFGNFCTQSTIECEGHTCYFCSLPYVNSGLEKQRTLRIAINTNTKKCGFAIIEDGKYRKNLTEIWNISEINQNNWTISSTKDYLYIGTVDTSESLEPCIEKIKEIVGEKLNNELNIDFEEQHSCSAKLTNASECRNYSCYDCAFNEEKETSKIIVPINEVTEEICLKAQPITISGKNIDTNPAKLTKMYVAGEGAIPDYSNGEILTLKLKENKNNYLLIDLKDYKKKENFEKTEGRIKILCDTETQFPSTYPLDIIIEKEEIQKTINLDTYQQSNANCNKAEGFEVLTENIEAELNGRTITITRKGIQEYEIANAKFRIFLETEEPQLKREEIKASYEYNWDKISTDFCNPEKENYVFCDNTQFLIKLIKTLSEQTNFNLLKENGYSFKIALMSDTLSSDMRNDFAEYYSQQLIVAGNNWNKYLTRNNLAIKVNSQSTQDIESGIYQAIITIDYLNGESLFWNSEPNANITINLKKIAEKNGEIYNLPYNGAVGIEGSQAQRNNYGVVFTNYLFDLDADINPQGFAKKTIRVSNLGTNEETVMKIIAEENNSEMQKGKITLVPILCASNKELPLPLLASSNGKCSEQAETKEICYYESISLQTNNEQGIEIEIPAKAKYEIKMDTTQKYYYGTDLTGKLQAEITGVPEKQGDGLTYKCINAVPLALSLEKTSGNDYKVGSGCYDAHNYKGETTDKETMKFYVNDVSGYFNDNEGSLFAQIKICTQEIVGQDAGIKEQKLEIENLTTENLENYKYIYYMTTGKNEIAKCDGKLEYLEYSGDNLAISDSKAIETKYLFGYEIKQIQNFIDYVNNGLILKKEQEYYWNTEKIILDLYKQRIPEGYVVCLK